MAGIQNQEDLAALFSRTSLNPKQHVEETPLYVESTETIAPPSYTSSLANPITYSISQHYTHSAHVAKVARRSSSEPISATDQDTLEIILARHGVDIRSLFPAQIELFKSAEVAQQMRLIELWRIAPPTYGGHALAPNLCTWHTTNFQQEEALAQIRYNKNMMEEEQRQRRQQDQYSQQDQITGMETNMIVPIQGGDGRWSGSDLTPTVNSQPEPYMASGYEQLAQREYEASSRPTGAHVYNPSTDPVYNIIPNSGPEWEQRQQQAMADQYGAYQQGTIDGAAYAFSDDMDMQL